MKRTITMANREEVAKNLREAGERLDKEAPSNLTAAAYTTLFELLESAGIREGNSYSDVFSRLADIIDPICHDFSSEEGTNGESYDFACSACGWCGDVTKPNYCPNCGSRVVRDEA